MSEKFISVNPDIMTPGKFYRVYTDKDNATLILLKDDEETLYNDVETLKSQVDSTPIGQCWVSPNGDDTNNGSVSKPFKTIQHALDGYFGLINLTPGTYTENLTIPTAYGLYAPIISGSGTFKSPKSSIVGTVTIGLGISRLRIKNLLVQGSILDNGSEGRHVLENVTVSGTGDLIKVTGGKNWWNVIGSTIEGNIKLNGTVNFNMMYSPNSYLCTVDVSTGCSFTAFCIGKLGIINHTGGGVYCSYVGSWNPTNGKIINSTSTNIMDAILVGYSAFTSDLITYGSIYTSGCTIVKNNNVEMAYSDVCLSCVSTTATSLITTTPSTLIAGTKKVERNISYNTSNGELTFSKSGSYEVALTLKIDCTEWNKKVEVWVEKFNGTSWDVVADTGFQQNFQTGQESVPHYDFASYFVSGEKYRLRAVSDSDTTVSLKTTTLTNGVKMPAIRLSIKG